MALGGVGLVSFDINDNERSVSFPESVDREDDGSLTFSRSSKIDVCLAGYNAEKDQFGNTTAYSLDDYIHPVYVETVEDGDPVDGIPKYNDERLIEEMLTEVRFGEFVFGVVSHETFQRLHREFFRALEENFGVIEWRKRIDRIDASPNVRIGTPEDYWFLARRGDFSFIPREGLEERGPSSFTINIRTSLIERLGEDGSFSTPISFSGKIKGENVPKPHRIFERRVSDKLLNLNENKGEEVTQDDYNAVSQPNLNNMRVSSGVLYENDFRTPNGYNADLGGWELHSLDRPQDYGGRIPGIRKMADHLVLGAPPIRRAIPPITVEEYDEETFWSEDKINIDTCASRLIRSNNAFYVSGSFVFSDDDNDESPFYINAFKSNGAYAFDGYGIALLKGEEDNIAVVDQSRVCRDNIAEKAIQIESFNIDSDKPYNFLLMYGKPPEESHSQSVKLSFWIWESRGFRRQSPLFKIGPHVPTNVQNEDALLPNQVGIGMDMKDDTVIGIRNIEIGNTDEIYVQNIIESNVSGQQGEISFTITAKGRGANTQNQILNSHSVYLWNYRNQNWVPLENPSYEDFNLFTHNVDVQVLPEYLQNNRITMLITTDVPHRQSIDNPINSELELNYFYGQSVSVERKTYGKTDFYFQQNPNTQETNQAGKPLYRPSEKTDITLPEASDLNIIEIDPTDNESFVAPIEEIYEIALLDDNDTETAILEPRREYRYFWSDENLRGSMREKIGLAISEEFVGAPIKIKARTYSQVRPLDNFFQNSDSRKIDGDILAKHKQSVFINIFGKYGGGVFNIEGKLREWVFNFSNEELRVSDVVSFLANEGASNILLYDGFNEEEAFRIQAVRIDKDGNRIKDETFSLLRRSVTEAFVPGNIKIITR